MNTKWLTSLAVATILFASTLTFAASEGAQLPKGKQTSLGLYVTAIQAYEKVKASDVNRCADSRRIRLHRPPRDGMERSFGFCNLSEKKR